MKAEFAGPDERGHFGPYGGRFVAETLMEPLRQLEEAYNRLKGDPGQASTSPLWAYGSSPWNCSAASWLENTSRPPRTGSP